MSAETLMTAGPDDLSYHSEALRLSSPDSAVYEAVATMEYSGQAPTRDGIASASAMPADMVSRTLDDLVRRGLLVHRQDGGEEVFAPANRGWSRAPGHPQGM